MSKKWLLSLSLAVFASLIVACGGEGDDAEENMNEDPDTQEEDPAGDIEEGAAPDLDGGDMEMPQPDLEGIPEVVAVVNGDEISKEEFENVYVGQFQQASMEAMMYGQELDEEDFKQQVVEALIGQELLVQEANNRNFDITEAEVNQLLEELAAQNGMEADQFMDALLEQGSDEEEVTSLLEMQAKIDQLIASEAGEFEANDEELEETYNQMLAQYEELPESEEDMEIPTFEEMKPELEQQARAQHETEAYHRLVGELRDNADITINI